MFGQLQLAIWQKGILFTLLPLILVTGAVIWREIYHAVHPDQKPVRKRKRKRY